MSCLDSETRRKFSDAVYLNVSFLLLALCPNVVNQRHLRTLNYLFYKRFVEVRFCFVCGMGVYFAF